MKKLFLLIQVVFLFLSLTQAYSQPAQMWMQRWDGGGVGGHNLDRPWDIKMDMSGNIYVIGVANGVFNPGYIFTNGEGVLIKYNNAGVKQWQRTYSGPVSGRDDWFYKMAIDNSGNIYVTGHSDGNAPSYDEDILTIKYNPNGDTLWVQRYSGPVNQDDRGTGIVVDNSGNAYVGGWISNVSSYDRDYILIKYNNAGVKQWERIYPFDSSSSRDEAQALTMDNSGNLIITGNTNTQGAGGWKIGTVKYSSNGVFLWARLYNGSPETDWPTDVSTDNNNNVFVTGYSSTTSGKNDFVTIKYNSSGTQQWIERYSGTSTVPDSSSDYAYDLDIDNSGNVYVIGYSRLHGIEKDFVTIKYNNNGDSLWVRRYNHTGGQQTCYGLDLDSNSNVYVTGYTSHPSGRFLTVKYNTTGYLQWAAVWDGGGADEGQRVYADNSGYVYVTGFSDIAVSSYDIITIKYDGLTGLQVIGNEIPDKYNLHQNYPNPFNPNTKIRFDIPKTSLVRLIVYDILGKEVTTLLNNEVRAGSYFADWNGKDYPSGVYFYKLFTNDFVDVKKMLLVK